MYILYWYHLPEHNDPKSQGYIGITNNLESRKSGHKYAALTKKLPYKFYNAYRKYQDDLIVEVLHTGNVEEITAKEIEYRPTEMIGWNSAIGGGFPPDITGRKHSEETKRKIGDAHKGVSKGSSPFKGMTNRYSDETKALIGSYHKGKTISNAHKKAISEKMSGANSPKSNWECFSHRDDLSVMHMFVSQKQAAEHMGSPYSSVRAQVQMYKNKGLNNYNRKGWRYEPQEPTD